MQKQIDKETKASKIYTKNNIDKETKASKIYTKKTDRQRDKGIQNIYKKNR